MTPGLFANLGLVFGSKHDALRDRIIEFINGPWFKVIPVLIGVGGFYFGYSQWRLRRAEQKEKREEADKQRREEQQPPEIYNRSGNDGPILIGGFDGPTRRLWGNVTIVNPTQRPMKIGATRLEVNGADLDVEYFYFIHQTQGRFQRISLLPLDKADYEVSFFFPENINPRGQMGELWLRSGNTPEPFPVTLRFA